MLVLRSATEDLYDFMLGEQPADGLVLPPGGVAPAPLLVMLRELLKTVRAIHGADWLIVDGHEVVGLIALKAPADGEGKAEIGYGVAESRWGRGYATSALALALDQLARDPRIRRITAETGVDNTASQRVLEKNGFVRTGQRLDPDDGEVICWEKP